MRWDDKSEQLLTEMRLECKKKFNTKASKHLAKGIFECLKKWLKSAELRQLQSSDNLIVAVAKEPN